jgi:hypothetical protein
VKADVERKMADTLAQVRAAGDREAETRIAEAQAQARAEVDLRLPPPDADRGGAGAGWAEAEFKTAAAGRLRGGAARDRAVAERLVARPRRRRCPLPSNCKSNNAVRIGDRLATR